MKRRYIMALILCICFGFFLLQNLVSINTINNAIKYVLSPTKDYKKYTTPLSPETISDLCQVFHLSGDDAMCQIERPTYAFDFYPSIKKFLLATPENKHNIGYVQEIIGKYNYKQEEFFDHDKQPYYRYWYDFNGDKLFPLVIKFSVDGKIEDVGITANRDSG